MKNLSLSLAIAGLAALLTACANQAGVVPAQVAQVAPPVDALQPDVAVVPKCKGQQTTKQYAKSQSQPLGYGGGAVCVPKFHGWGGHLKYPGGASGVSATLISSTTAYASDFPPGVTAMFWIQFELSYRTLFNSTLAPGLSLAYPKLKVKKPYTISGADYYGSLFRSLPSCYTIAASGKYGPMIGGLGYPLKGSEIHYAFIWVTSGKHATTKC